MAVIKYEKEIKLKVPHKRIFKAMVTDPYTHLANIMPNAIKSVEKIKGDGGVGTIRKTTFPDGRYLLQRLDELDVENCGCKYTSIGGDVLDDKLDKVHYDQKFVDSGDGGCILKLTSQYHTKNDVSINEEEIKAGNEQLLVFFTLTEQYLLAHPQVCA